MKRVTRYIEAGKKLIEQDNCNITMSEAKEIMEMANNSRLEAILYAFYMGVEAGARIKEK
jgi:hypothetical protein